MGVKNVINYAELIIKYNVSAPNIGENKWGVENTLQGSSKVAFPGQVSIIFCLVSYARVILFIPLEGPYHPALERNLPGASVDIESAPSCQSSGSARICKPGIIQCIGVGSPYRKWQAPRSVPWPRCQHCEVEP